MTPRQHILQELGFDLVRAGAELHGSAGVVPEMCVPGTTSIRTSILAAWTDMTAGTLAVDLMDGRVPVTIELDVHLYEPRRASSIHAVGRLLKAGRSVAVLTVDFTTEDGAPLAVGTGSFMAAPDATLTLPSTDDLLAAKLHNRGSRLSIPFAERARCERVEPGVAVLPRSDDGLNSSNTVNGGLIGLTVEEAVLSLSPGTTLSSLAMRYLQPARVGPVVATAQVRGGLGRVEVRDAGNDDRLAVVATTRTF